MAQAQAEYQPNSFREADFSAMLERLAIAWGCNVADFSFTAYYSTGAASDKREITLGEARVLTGIVEPLDHLMIHYRIGKPEGRTAHLRRSFDGLSITVDGDDMIRAQNTLNVLASTLGVTEYMLQGLDEELAARMDDAESRLSSLERAASAAPLRSFISFRFSEGSAAIAREVEQYLAILGVDVVTGFDYEPRRVEDKVRDRLLSGVDFVVYLVTSEGESSWLRDELATATAAGALPVPLVENGSMLDQGLLGNIEYIPFDPGHPGDCWIRLAQAVRYVGAVRSTNEPDERSEQDSH
jgi:hypothetical protein